MTTICAPRCGSVHPHGRGDNPRPLGACSASRGSPPRAWGQCQAPSDAARHWRFTPTGVGTMLRRSRAPWSATVHPHGRGDNSVTPSRHAINVGSPPRAWGQSIVNAGEQQNLRFTPTGVGTMLSERKSIVGSGVHPHGRGDNDNNNNTERRIVGSPPRAWGQCAQSRAAHRRRRFTPTGVGTIPPSAMAYAPYPVHPHGRGDNVRAVGDLRAAAVHPHGRG